MPPQLNLPLSKPTFNWDATNLHEAFKGFKQQCDNLLSGPYSDHSGEAKVSAIHNWLGIKSYSIFDTVDLTEEQKKDYKEVLAKFQAYFKPSQSVLQSWYQLGGFYSNQFNSQVEFMQKIKDVVEECGFDNKEEITKLIFLIHNTDTHVREYLIDKLDTGWVRLIRRRLIRILYLIRSLFSDMLMI